VPRESASKKLSDRNTFTFAPELDRMIAGAAATPNHREVVHHLKQRLASSLWERRAATQ
jgi:hypothetical protein